MPANRPLSISVATAWAQEFLRREWRLTLPVALALMGLPALAVELLAPTPERPQDFGMVLPYMIPAAIVTLVGTLAVVALALVPAISVAEALRMALKRLLAIIGAMLLAGLAGGAIAVLVALVLVSIGGASQAETPARLATSSTIVMLVMIALTARLCLIWAVVLAERVGPVAALRRSWVLSRGHFWRLFSLILMVMLASAIVTMAADWGTGVIAALIGRAAGIDQIVDGVVAIAGALVNATISMMLAVLIAAIYRQLEPV